MKLKRSIYIYFRFLIQQVKAILEYQSDFFIAMAAGLLTQSLGLIFIWAIFERIPHINGWSLWEIVFMYSLIFIAEGVSSFLFNGIWLINGFVNRGELDRFLLRPVSPLLQVMSSAFGLNGIVNIILGLVFLLESINKTDTDWGFLKLLALIIFIISGVGIRIAVNLIANSASFWTQGPRNSLPVMVHSAIDFCRYPITIYSMGIQIIISIFIPYAFISYFPTSFIFGKDQWSIIGLLTPIVSIFFLYLSIRIFYRGIKKYESVGN